MKTGTCRLCEGKVFKLSQNSTSPLWKHLEQAHKTDFDKIEKLDPLRKVGKVTKSFQPTIVSAIQRKDPYGTHHPKQKQFDENFKKQIINDALPFRVAESKAFRKTIYDLDPRIVVKSRITYSRQLVREGSTVRKKIRNFVRNGAKGILALTTDMWEDRKQNSFCSLTAHFTGEDFKLKRIVTAIKFFGTGRHTGENIAEVVGDEIKQIKGDENEDLNICLVSDSASSMVKMRDSLKQRGVIDKAFGCSLHMIQNAIKDANKSTKGVTKTVIKAKKVIKHIRKSNLAANRLKKACSKVGHKCLQLKKCVDIRWNSEYVAFERLLYHQECIEMMDRNQELEKISKFILNRNDWRILKVLVDILEPVKVLTSTLETQSKPSINRVAEGLFDIDEGLRRNLENPAIPAVTKAYARNLKNHLIARFPNYGLDEKFVLFDNFLDPHLRGIHIEQKGLMAGAKAGVKTLIKAYNVSEENGENESDDGSSENMSATQRLLMSRKERQPVSSIFDEQSSGEKAADAEISLYMTLPYCTRNVDVLSWWSENEKRLPRLSILARWILCIPAGSAASEQLFSMAGLFDTIRRGRLNTETFELLTLQKVNQEVIESENLTAVTEDQDSDVNENYVDDPNEDAVEVLGDITNEPSDNEDDDEFPGCVYGTSESSGEESALDESREGSDTDDDEDDSG